MPAKIQEVDTALKLVRKFRLVGQITPQLDETIVPVVVLDDLSPEDFRAAAGGIQTGPPGVGAYNIHALVNPADSGKLLLLQDVTVSTGTVATPTFMFGIDSGFVGYTAPIVGGRAFIDSRRALDATDPTPAGEVREATVGAVGSPGSFVAVGTTDGVGHARRFFLSAQLIPGWMLGVQIQADNQQLTSSWTWAERPIQDGDLR